MPRVPEKYLQARTAEILEAAFRCFSESGFRATSMADIAREAGLSVGALYRYFKSKDDLFRALTTMARSKNMTAWDQAAKDGNERDKVEAFIRQYFASIALPECRPTLALDTRLRAEAIDSDVVTEELKDSYQFQINSFSSLLRDAAGDKLAKADADGAARVVIAIMIEAGFQALIDPRTDLEVYQRAAIEHVRQVLERTGPEKA